VFGPKKALIAGRMTGPTTQKPVVWPGRYRPELRTHWLWACEERDEVRRHGDAHYK
jgi:hypothetical protein